MKIYIGDLAFKNHIQNFFAFSLEIIYNLYFSKPFDHHFREPFSSKFEP